jgi:hypothetical protein
LIDIVVPNKYLQVFSNRLAAGSEFDVAARINGLSNCPQILCHDY